MACWRHEWGSVRGPVLTGSLAGTKGRCWRALLPLWHSVSWGLQSWAAEDGIKVLMAAPVVAERIGQEAR